MDRLSVCRKYLYKLSDEELLECYNLLCTEYGEGEFALENDMKYIETILNLLKDFNLSYEDWTEAINNGNYNPTDKYIEVGRGGVISFEDNKYFLDFVSKKMNGEVMCMIEDCLEGDSILKYAVIHDEENEEFHLCIRYGDFKVSSRKVLVGCEDLHEIFKLAHNYNIGKSDIVDYLKIDEVKEWV